MDIRDIHPTFSNLSIANQESMSIPNLLRKSDFLIPYFLIPYELLIITWDTEKEEKIKGKNIKFIPLWQWLLKE